MFGRSYQINGRPCRTWLRISEGVALGMRREASDQETCAELPPHHERYRGQPLERQPTGAFCKQLGVFRECLVSAMAYALDLKQASN